MTTNIENVGKPDLWNRTTDMWLVTCRTKFYNIQEQSTLLF